MSVLDESSSLISSDRTVRWLFAIMVGLFVITVLSFGVILHTENVAHRFVNLANELRVMSQQLPLQADQALKGDEPVFRAMQESRQRFQRNLVALEAGDEAIGIPVSPAGALPKLEDIKNVWKDFGKSVDVLVEHQQIIQNAGRQLVQLKKRLQELSAASDQVTNNLIGQNADVAVLSKWISAQRYSSMAEQVVTQLDRALSGSGDVKRLDAMFVDLQQNEGAFAKVIDAMLKGNAQLGVIAVSDQATRELMREVDAVFRSAQGAFADIYDDRNDLLTSGAAAGMLFNNADKLGGATGELLQYYTGPSMARAVPTWVPLVLFSASLLLLFALWLKTRSLERLRLDQSEREKRLADEQAERNRKAIMRLLDEIEGLSEGDLTVHASVDEAFTGAIADSFNTAIDALRSLVTTINETAVQVSSAAEETQATALHLTDAADHQAHQITAASAAVNEMAVSIDQVSQNAVESAEVAKRAVGLAHKGADTVRRTITGMDTIREQIQETSKRIKRLGESSQEIGNIVELINDIADQTNILALNASIQAAMAGDAGRGFAVVADEVQRLAERSSNATKQIEALVKTIQSDTNEAVISMEQSTAEVVNGARLAQDGGEALKEIEQVSAHLANLILSISEAAKQQASAAASISDTMNVIQEITTQTAAGTNETATSIGNLAELANELRTSVAGFKLPA